MMNPIMQTELDECMALCSRLEDLLLRDMEEIPQCLTGELCDTYTDATEAVLGTVAQMKRNLMVLHSSL